MIPGRRENPQQQEIDLIEEAAGGLNAYEFKWDKGRPGPFSPNLYSKLSGAETQIVRPDYLETFLLEDEKKDSAP